MPKRGASKPSRRSVPQAILFAFAISLTPGCGGTEAAPPPVDAGVEDSGPYRSDFPWPPMTSGEPFLPDAPGGPRPAWEPPFSVADTADWGTSTEPFCNPRWGYALFHSLWAADGEVFLSVGSFPSPSSPDDPRGWSLHRNDGTGWESLLSYDYVPNSFGIFRWSMQSMAGSTEAGFLFGDGAGCDVARLRAGEIECALHLNSDHDDRFLQGILAEGDEIIVLMDDGIHHYDGSEWRRVFEFEDAEGGVISGRPSHYVVARGLSEVFTVENGIRAERAPAPLGGYGAVALDETSGDVLLSTYSGTFRHDGGSWQLLVPPTDCGMHPFDPIRRFWVGEDRVYFIRASQFGYIENLEFTSIVSYDCPEDGMGTGPEFRDIAGLTDDQVFLLMNDGRALAEYECGDVVTLWFDGNELHYL